MDTPPHSVVFDPFAGAGTTIIEAKLEGHTSVGCEINPFLHFVCQTSVEWGLDGAELETQLVEIGRRFEVWRSDAGGRSLDELGLSAPPIYNVYRWWRPDILVDLLLLLKSIRACTSGKATRFFELGLAGVLVPDLTNVTLGRLQLHFIDRDDADIDVWNTFLRHVEKMINDAQEISRLKRVGSAKLYCADSTTLKNVERLTRVNRVITSPPYPNRYSYVWNSRPYLYLLGFFETATQAGDLDLNTIGGTWGTATSSLMKGKLTPEFAAVEQVVSPVVEAISAERQSDGQLSHEVF
jgi:hypothetical protein